MLCLPAMDHTVLPPSVWNAEPTNAELEENFAYTNYRLRVEDLSRLKSKEMPETWICGNGSRFDGETGLSLLFVCLRYDCTITVSAVVCASLQEHQQRLAAITSQVIFITVPTT